MFCEVQINLHRLMVIIYYSLAMAGNMTADHIFLTDLYHPVTAIRPYAHVRNV